MSNNSLKQVVVALTLLASLIQLINAQKRADASSASLIFNSNDLIVNPNERLNLECGVDGEYRSCIWEKAGSDQSLQVEDVHQGRIGGISKPEVTKGNECGIVIENVDPSRHGQWTCKIFVIAKTLRGSKNVIVTIKPAAPSFDVNMNPLVVPENQEHEVSCTVAAARPSVRVRWSVGSEDITAHSRTENTETDDQGTYRSVSTLRYKFHHKFNRNMLRCNIEHFTLTEPLFSEIELDVRFHPYSISSTQFYGIPIEENEYEIKFNLTSNPQPDARWIVGDQEVPVPEQNADKYETRIVPLMDTVYMIGLKIHDVNPLDIGNTYKLIVSNEVGDRNFDISLSTGPAPPDHAYDTGSSSGVPFQDPIRSQDTMGTGTLIAIIVVVLFIIILIFIIVVMRYRQMYCFGPQDKVKDHLKSSGETLRDEHDTESAREPIPSKTSKTTAASPFKNIRMKFKRKDQKESKLENIEEGEGGVDNPARTPPKEGDLRGGGAHDNRSQVTED